MTYLVNLDTEKAFEHAVTLAAGFLASGQVHYHLGDLASGGTVDARVDNQRDQIADLVHTLYAGVLQAYEMVRADTQTQQ